MAFSGSARVQLDGALEGQALLGCLDGPERAVLATFLDRICFDPGVPIIQEGANDRDFYVMLEGTADITRGGVHLGSTGPGEQFGELALMVPRPRSASIVARTPVVTARLSPEGFDALSEAHPALALRLARSMIGGVGQRLRDLSDDVGRLLNERSLPRRLHVEVRVAGQTRTARTGEPVSSVLPERIDGRRVVAALVDHIPRSLVTPLTASCDIVPITTADWEGRRVYRSSIALLLLEAARRVAPEVGLQMDHSVGLAQRVNVRGDGLDFPELASRLDTCMREMVAEDRVLREELWTLDEAIAHFDETGRHEVVQLLQTRRNQLVFVASYGRVQVLGIGPLLARTGGLDGFSVIAESDVLLLLYGTQGSAPETMERVGDHDTPAVARMQSESARRVARHTEVMTLSQRRWLRSLGIRSVGAFNQACIDGRVSEMIRVSEGSQEKRISRIADALTNRADTGRVVCIAGPSSSGKTTFIKRLSVQLQVEGLQPVNLSLDDYFVDRAHTPRDVDGEYDFEAFEALNSDLLSRHLTHLLAGESVTTARYDFPTGTSQPEGGPTLALDADDVLMIEGIHGLNPALLAAIPPESVFRIFLCPLQQLSFDDVNRIHASDVRLLRRLVRDRHSRGHAAADTIRRWPSVRRGERAHIFPYVQHADAVFDSSLVYELSVLKVFAERYLLEVRHDDPARSTAYRLLDLLDQFVTIYPNHVPPTSIVREFIGGSGFEY